MALITVAGHTMDDSKWDMYCIRHKDGRQKLMRLSAACHGQICV